MPAPTGSERRLGSRWIARLLLLALCAPSPAGAEDAGAHPWVELGRRPGRGERSLVSGKPIEGSPLVEIRYRGRTFAVASAELDRFEANPDRYFRSLQAHSALFDERAPSSSSPIWLGLGLVVVCALFSGALCGYLAIRRNGPTARWFFWGLAGNLPAALLILLRAEGRGGSAALPRGRTKVPSTRDPCPCPSCGAMNHPAASRCSSCKRTLSPRVEAEHARLERRG